MSVHSRSALLSFAVAAALGQVPTAAFAQQLEEIVVTARLVSESLQSAPVAVTAVTSETIENQGLRNINDISQFTPGLQFSQAFGRTTDRPVIRGQSNVLAGVQFGVESGAAYFVDGVYWPGDVQGLDLNSFERVEVIKGPQSALYGRNTYSGAINFITRPPSDDVEATVRASLAQYGTRDLLVLGRQQFLGRQGRCALLRAQLRLRRPVQEHAHEPAGRRREHGFRRPLPDLEADRGPEFATNMMYRQDDDGPLALFLQPATTNNCKPGFRSTFYRDPPSGGDARQRPEPVLLRRDRAGRRGAQHRSDRGHRRSRRHGLRRRRDRRVFRHAARRLGHRRVGMDRHVAVGLSLVRQQVRHRQRPLRRFRADAELQPERDPAGFQTPGIGTPQEKEPLFANTNRDVIRSKSTELRIASPQDKPVRGLIGYYWYDYSDQGRDLTFADANNGDKDYLETVEDQAVFGMISWNFWEGLTINAELRYMEETKERTEYCSTAASTADYNPWTNSCTNWGPAMQPGNPLFYNNPLGTVNYNEKADFDSTTPRITLDWQINPDNMVYLVFAQGVKPGGLNGIAGQRIDQPTYDQEESDNWEIGNKLFMFDRRLRLNTALYWIDASSVQFTQSVPNPGGTGAVTSIATNQGGGETYGFELDSEARVDRCGDGRRHVLVHAHRDHQGLRRLRVHAEHGRRHLRSDARHRVGVQHRG